MKKVNLFITAMTLCFVFLLVGCSRSSTADNVQSESCRVLCLKDDGIIVWIENIGNVYVKNVDTTLEIEPLDTVVMEFSKDDLKSANEKFTDFFGEEQVYSNILENPKHIRHTKEDEPTFG